MANNSQVFLRRLATTLALILIAPTIGAGRSWAQTTLNEHRDRLIRDWASNPNIGFGTDACAAWNTLSTSARWVFIANTHRLYWTGLLADVDLLYSIRGGDGNGAVCGGIEFNRTFMRMSPGLQGRLAQTIGGNRSIVPGWRETHDPACVTGFGECPHKPFTGQVETQSDGPTGQIQFFSSDGLIVQREYREADWFSPLFGQICDTRFVEVARGSECSSGGCVTPASASCSMGVYGDAVVKDPRAPYYRGAVGYAIADPLSFEMDQDYGLAHDSNPWCFAGPYTSKWGDPGWNWEPSACTPPPPSPCVFSISPSVENFGTNGGSASFTISTGSGCHWSTSLSATAAGWLSLTSAPSGDGYATVTYSVVPNPSSRARTGWIYVGGTGVQVTQAGLACTLTLTPSTATFDYVGGTGTATLGSTVSDCGWSVSSSASWIGVRSATIGSGPSVVSYSIDVNTSPSARSGTITAGGRTLTISQNGRPRKPAADFDGDGRSDVTVFRPSTGQWLGILSSTGAQSTFAWGSAGDIPVAADYDGDRKTDLGVFTPSTGTWWRILSTVGVGSQYQYGTAGDIPVPGDYDGDGKAEAAVFRPSTGQWRGRLTTTGIEVVTPWGSSGDIPVPADYDGDGKTDLAVFRPSTGEWHRILSTVGVGSTVVFGAPGDVPVPADYDADWKADIATYRPSTGEWRSIRTTTGSQVSVPWGSVGDRPVVGDYNGDGAGDAVVFRPSTSEWLALLSPSGTPITAQFGRCGDIPIAAPRLAATSAATLNCIGVSPGPVSALGAPITWTASASAISGNVEYKYSVYNASTLTWVYSGGWVPQNTFSYFPSTTGSFYAQVWVRASGSTATYEDWKNSAPTDVRVINASITSVASTAGANSPVGSPIGWTVTAAAGVLPVEYRYFVYDSDTTTWVYNGGWVTASTFSFTPASAGYYHLQVWVRVAGKTVAYDDWRNSAQVRVP